MNELDERDYEVIIESIKIRLKYPGLNDMDIKELVHALDRVEGIYYFKFGNT